MKNDVHKLNSQKIFYTALKMLDEDGLDNLSMRKLGEKLGVKAMSLYNYIQNKEDLFNGIVDIIFQEINVQESTSCWKSDLRIFSCAFREVLIRHPNALPLIATRPITTEVGLKKVEYVLSILNRGGIVDIKALYTLHILIAFVTGHGFLESGAVNGQIKLTTSEYVKEMKHNLDLKQFHYISELFPKMSLYSSKEQFDYGIKLIIESL